MVNIMNKVPELRFTGFNDEWRHLSAKKIIERVTRKNKGSKSNLPLTISAQYGLVDQETFFNKKVASDSLEGYYLLERGEFAYNKSYSNGYPYGAIKRLEKYELGVVSSLYICFNGLDTVNSDFLMHYFESSKWYKEISMIAVEGARNHGLLNISVLDFFETLHYIPRKEEQEKIAAFLNLIDMKIEKHREKVEMIKLYRKGISKRLFSQELRFKDIDNREFSDWKKCKVGNLFDERSERGFDENELLAVTIQYGVTKRSEIEGKDNSSEDKSKYKLVKKNDIVYNTMRMWQGANGASDLEGIVSPAYTILKSRKSLCSKYFAYLFKTPEMLYQFKKYSQGLTSDTWNLKYNQIKDITIYVPELKEQEKIVDFLEKMDEKLRKECLKLEYLKESKSGLLQQMFV